MRVCRHCHARKPLREFYHTVNGNRDHYCKVCRGVRVRRARLKHRYGITEDQWDEMFSQQGGQCLSCATSGVKLCVDHDHRTGEVRGLICYPCNLLIGKLEKVPVRLIKVLDYLDAFPPSPRELMRVL